MSDIARRTGLSRGSLYAALSGQGSPQLDTVMKVLGALQLELKASTREAAPRSGITAQTTGLVLGVK